MNYTNSNSRLGPSVIAGEWEDRFPLQYAAASQENRKRRRDGKRTSKGSIPPADPDHADRSLARDVAIERARSLADIKRGRQELGYRFFGGAVGGNPLYARQGFVFRGLVSDEAPILKLFATKTPRARRLLTGDTKDRVDGTDSKLLALDSPYVTTNARMRGVIRVDIDARLDSWTSVSEMCDQVQLPLPNVAVGHVDESGRVLNPHLIWIIANSVAFTPKARPKPQRLFLGVQRGLTAALAPHGADPGGLSNPLHMKNPLCPAWDRAIFRSTPYHLTDLRTEADKRLATSTVPTVNHRATATSGGSNRGFWDLCAWARRNVMNYRPTGLYEEFFQAVEAEALRVFVDLATDKDRAGRAAQKATGSVSRWTWDRYDPANFPAAPLPPDELFRRQSAAGKSTTANRRSATEAAILSAAKALMQGHGGHPTQSELAAATGKSERTIRRYWVAVLDLVPDVETEPTNVPAPATCYPLDKKEAEATPPADTNAELPGQAPFSTLQETENIGCAESASLSCASTPPPLSYDAPVAKIHDRSDTVSLLPRDGRPQALLGPQGSLTRLTTPAKSPGQPVPSAPRSTPAMPAETDSNLFTPTLDLNLIPRRAMPALSKELAHATPMPALNAQPLIGRNILIENSGHEPVGPFTERYRSLLKTFLINAGTTLDPAATEQTGRDVWKKMYAQSESRNHAILRSCNLVVLYLDPRQELRLKFAREPFKREVINYADVLGPLILHRLVEGLLTWIFTPCRLDDPEFISVYGTALAGLLDTGFTPVRFGKPPAGPVARRHPLNPEHLRWNDERPPDVFIHPEAGVTAKLGAEEPHRPSAANALVDQAVFPASPITLPTLTPDEAAPSVYVAEMARIRSEYARLRYRLGAPSPAPATPNVPKRNTAKEAPSGQPARRFYSNDIATPPSVRRTFHADYTVPQPKSATTSGEHPAHT